MEERYVPTTPAQREPVDTPTPEEGGALASPTQITGALGLGLNPEQLKAFRKAREQFDAGEDGAPVYNDPGAPFSDVDR